MREPLRIGLVVSYSLAYCRGILRGIKRYARTRQDWIFTPVAPEAGGVRALRPAGVIAHIYSGALADRLLALGRPLVRLSRIRKRFPRDGNRAVTAAC